MNVRKVWIAGALLACGVMAGCESGSPRRLSEYRANQAEANNMRLLGFHDLQNRSAYAPELHQQGGRWIAYIGHHGGKPKINPMTGIMETNGTSIVDVTDPRNPRYLVHIPGQEGGTESGGAQMTRLCNGSQLPKGDRNKVYMLRSFGTSAHEMWDVTNPEKPVMITVIVRGLRDTHKNWWECDTGIAYLVSGVKGWKTRRMMQVYDLSDPAKPVHIRDFGLPGQEPTSKSAAPDSHYMLHGPISTGTKGNRVYLGFGTVRNGVIQILDREKLLKGAKEPTPANLLDPQVSVTYLPSYMGAHTTLPVLGMEVRDFTKNSEATKRDILVVVNESTANECRESRQLAYILDITNDKTPLGISSYQPSEASGDYCARGGRFGAHASNENQPPMYYGRMVFMSWFNAGVRAVDIRDPFHPKEVAWYIPAITDKTDQRCVKDAGGARCKIAIQTNNVEVDGRGYIYIVDRADTGMHVLELTGTAREAANFK